MSVYVGIDVHRKRSQVAVIDSGGEVLANGNVPDGTETILGVIGGLPPGTPAAIRGRVRLGVAAGLLEDYGFDPHLVHPLQCQAIASARLKNDKGRCRDPGAAAARGPAAGGCGTAPSWCGCGRCCGTGSTRSWPTTARTGPQAAGAAPAGAGSPRWTCRRAPGRGSTTTWPGSTPCRGRSTGSSPGCAARSRPTRWL